MYESPITMYMSDIQREINRQAEDEMMVAINQSIGFDVDKNELIKALQYDREQYDKGFSDCKSYMLGKIEQAEEEIQELLNQEVIIDNTTGEPTELTETGEGLNMALGIIHKLIESEGLIWERNET